MTGKKNEPREELARLADALAEDLMETPDDEILAEAAEDCEDVDAEVERVRRLIEQAIVEAGKRRMERAKAGARARTAHGRPKVLGLPIEKKREILRRFATHAHRSVEEVRTLAARKEDELTEEDLDAMLEALFQLGTIDDQGDPK